MKRREVKDFIQAGINLLTEAMSYGAGRLSEFDSNRSMTYPQTWAEPITVSTNITASGLNVNDWSVKLNIAKKDKPDSSADEYEEIVDQCDEIAQELIQKLNQIVSGNEIINLKSISREPFVKKNADCLTGVVLSFTLNAPDKTNWCC